jgi:hypothetical protein
MRSTVSDRMNAITTNDPGMADSLIPIAASGLTCLGFRFAPDTDYHYNGSLPPCQLGRDLTEQA